MLLKNGDSGEFVTYLQYGLYILCCNPNGFDGQFGNDTLSAVKKFQSKYNLTADGVVGDNTWNKLSSEISYIQYQLNSKGYGLDADGIAGPNTYNTIISFQIANGLDADGIVGPNTRSKLFNGSSISSASSTLSKGSSGSDVTRLQTLLINRGYSCGSSGADGIFGNGTFNAVIAFQSANGLVVDGIVGPLTWAALNDSSGVSTSATPTLSKGSSGPAVSKLQNLLINHGYSCGGYGADGIFGNGTFDAVIAFQGDHGLDADGIVGPLTWVALNDTSTPPNTAPQGTLELFVQIAQKEVDTGFHEYVPAGAPEGDNMNKYGAWYGYNGVPWCAEFVSWCANQAGILGSIVPKYKYCPYGANWYYSKGRLKFNHQGYIPKRGDVFFHLNDKGEYSHTGIVADYSNGYVTTLEGNVHDQLTSRRIELKRNYNDPDQYFLDAFGVN